METKVLSVDGKELRTIELNDSVFACAVSDGSIYHAIRNELANARQGTSSSKTRSEVEGSHKKPWRQKGTGRARSGTRQSPVWVGGGVAFGPHPRDYSYRLPKKVKRHAIKSILSQKTAEGALKVVEDFSIETGKTRELVRIMTNLAAEKRSVLVLKDDDRMVKRAAANIPGLTFLSYNRLCAHELFYGKTIIMMETAATKLGDFFSKARAEGESDES